MQEKPEKLVYKYSEAGRLLSVTPSTIKRLAEKGVLVKVCLGGRRTMGVTAESVHAAAKGGVK